MHAKYHVTARSLKMGDRELPPNPPGLVIRQERDRGSYGAVYSGELDGKPVVVKRIHLALLQAPNNDKLMGDFYRECRILSTVRHANVVRFIGAYWDQEAKEPLLVMEAAKENLREYLERNKGHLGVEKQLAICSSMTEGLSFLHTRAEPIIHRDLKPQNVLVWEDGAVKIADFGQSKLLDHPQDYMKTVQPGTIAYMPPEALKRNPRYSSKVDVFSLGVVMLEVGTQSPPSVWLEGIGAVPEVERHKDDLALLQDTHPLKPLIIWCLQDNHESRPDVKSTQDQVILLSGGVKEPEYQQRIHQLEAELRESREREADLLGRLEEAALELRCTKAQVADLERLVEKGQLDLKQSRMRYEEEQEQLMIANRTTREELKAVRNQLGGATRDLSDTRRDKESLEAELTHLRQTLDAWTAAVERRDEECLSKVKELEALLSSRNCSVKMQSAGEHTSKSPTLPILPHASTSPTTVPSQSGVEPSVCLEKEAVRVEAEERRASSNNEVPKSPGAEDALTSLKCVDCKRQLSAEEILQCKVLGEALVCDECSSDHLSCLQDDSDDKGSLDQANVDTLSSPDVVPEGPMCMLPGCPKQAQMKGRKYDEFCSKAHYQMYGMMTPSPVSLNPSTSQRSPTSPTEVDTVSHTTAPSGGHSNWESHSSQLHHHSHPPRDVIGGLSGWKTCYTCGAGYSSLDLGACPKCHPRGACKSGCGKPAFYPLELGSFGYCSAECRDRCELERAKSELTRALKGFEVNPGRVSSEAPAKESVSHGALSQPLTRPQSDDTPINLSQSPTRSRPRSTDKPSTLGGIHGTLPTQLPPPQGKVSVIFRNFKLSRDAIRAFSLYDKGRLLTVNGINGILVTSMEVNKDTLASGVQPLDLITLFDDKRAESLGDPFGQCNLFAKMTKTTADVWIARTSLIPSMSDLQSLVEPQQSMRKPRIVGFLVTKKDLADPATFLGVHMCEYSTRKVDRVSVPSEGDKAGLRDNDIIQSVTVVTTKGVVGPETDWSFDRISRIAKNSPSVCALLMTVLNL